MLKYYVMFVVSVCLNLAPCRAVYASSKIGAMIRNGEVSTSDLIVSSHPRMWIKGEWGWNQNNYGSFAWRIIHGPALYPDDPNNDQEIGEFYALDPSFLYDSGDYSTYSLRFLWVILYAKALQLGWQNILPETLPGTNLTFNPQYSSDEFFADAREKLLWTISQPTIYEVPNYVVILGSVGYDWLVSEKYSNGDPVLSDADKTTIQDGLIKHAEYLKNLADDSGELFKSEDIAPYAYAMVGFALYEPDRLNDPAYAEVNATAKSYLDDFDTYWVGKIIPALNTQGSDGGWHGGLGAMYEEKFDQLYSVGQVLPWHISRILYAHYTATGQDFEDSLFSEDFMKNGAIFQNYMIRPNGEYYDIGPVFEGRYAWIGPLRMFSRRRFSTDLQQQKIAELGDWVRRYKAPDVYVNYGSYDLFDQVMFEDKWPDSRAPEQIGFPKTKLFRGLGWVFIRSGFEHPEDLAALFVCQHFHWSDLTPYAQNSLTLEHMGRLLEGYQNTIWIDDAYQRQISGYPSISEGVEKYADESKYDVGPGIQKFESNRDFDYIMGDASRAYDANKVSRFTRQLIYLKPDRFIILDKVVTTSPETKKAWVVNPSTVPVKLNNDLVRIVNGDAALWIKRLLPVDATISTLSDEKLEVVPTRASTETKFLHVLQALDSHLTANSTEVVADDAVLIHSGDSVVVRIGVDEIRFLPWDEVKIIKNGFPVSVRTKTNFVDFQAFVVGFSVILNWNAETEKDMVGFEIERSQGDLRFTKIGFVAKHAENSASKSYQFVDDKIATGFFQYRLKIILRNGAYKYSGLLAVTVSEGGFNLRQNYPNPFNPETTIVYEISKPAVVLIRIFDIKGQEIATLINEPQEVGSYEIVWRGTDKEGHKVASGVYFCSLEAMVHKDNVKYFDTRKMVVVQ